MWNIIIVMSEAVFTEKKKQVTAGHILFQINVLMIFIKFDRDMESLCGMRESERERE